ncbi:hypothetical protein FOVG_19292 [Fusarium oxysporum f. sp. pisi HDV247]|uniref:BZIP domain-containing protein n=2 Tax=Fusarium oxysporum TaxID=5507 RepID=A0A420M927_FUSOX|nr:hypothetical protein FOVG_19292 [Fusarium oxysporum f. sp. pisi HDV247]KAH7187915.1 hypothetical protein DER44DRAFT_680064 [Fusarium oxysporum]RKK61045.1 hypothetical protein BFJ69_g17163 [Fusarium oxysporum]
MTPSYSAEPAKPKRKGPRRISTLTPSQLARKRAKDREAQRAIRARTKEHIERLDCELAELKMRQSRDQTVQELLHRNRALEEELMRLKKDMRVQITSSFYSAPGLNSPQLSLHDSLLSASTFNDNLGTSSDAIPSPRGSPFPGNYDYLPDYNQQYVPLSNNCESWASTVSCPVPFNVSIPLSSADYSAGYISTSVPSSILPSNTNSSSISVVFHKDVVEMEYNNVGRHSIILQGLPLPDVGEEGSSTQCLDAGFQLSNPPLQPGTPHSHRYISHHCHQPSAWKI